LPGLFNLLNICITYMHDRTARIGDAGVAVVVC